MEIVEVIGFEADSNPVESLPLFTMSVSAGVPVSVDNDTIIQVDLNEFLIDNPASTFFVKVRGNSSKFQDISDDDILVVDEKAEPFDGNLVVVALNGELSVKIYREANDKVYLESYDNKYLPLEIEPYMKFYMLGKVTKIIHSL
jgi:DNA polymerase V